MSDFLVWLPAIRPDNVEAADVRSAEMRAFRPGGHSTRQRFLIAAVNPGDRLWLLRRSNLCPSLPSLDGKIIVEACVINEQNIWFSAAEQSVWYGWNDASDVLKRIRLHSKHGLRSLNVDRPLGPQLRSARRIEATSAANLARHTDVLAERPRLFISYSWRDSSDIIDNYLLSATHAGFAPWVDRWSGPRRLADGGETVDDPSLEDLLRGAISASQAALLITSPRVESAPWPKFERKVVLELGIPFLEVSGSQLSSDELLELFNSLRRRSLPDHECFQR